MYAQNIYMHNYTIHSIYILVNWRNAINLSDDAWHDEFRDDRSWGW